MLSRFKVIDPRFRDNLGSYVLQCSLAASISALVLIHHLLRPRLRDLY